MHLEDQIEYEFNALKLLHKTGRTPEPYYVDGSKSILPYGVLVMEYIQGSPLDYNKDLRKAAAIFADIHSCDTIGADFLIKPEDPADAILDECKAMTSVFFNSLMADKDKKDRLRRFVDSVESKLLTGTKVKHSNSIVNTEVNSGNFLINDDIKKCYLIDWEKPVISEAAQDLAHFIAPTTTYWKTDCILDEDSKQEFIKEYCDFSNGSFDIEYMNDRINAFMPVTCLRGLSWCAMAWVEYNQLDRPISNEYTYNKICSYLKDDFLNMLERRYFNA
jgi:aminoglycoside phosphotransferase (APT) family kinase protein